MTDKAELLDLALRCRSLSAQCDDDSTIRTLDRLADDFETQARIVDHLAKCPQTPRGARKPSTRRSVARAPDSGAPGTMLATHG